MRLVRAGLLLQFAEEKRRYSVSDDVYERLAGERAKEHRAVPERGVRLRITEEKETIEWNPRMCRLGFEQVSNFEQCSARILELLSTINEVAPIGELSLRRVFTYWILPTPKYDFVSLEKKYRQTMIIPRDIADVAFDSSVILDIPANENTLHHQSGPMSIEQLLREYLLFKPSGLPSVFLFLEAGIEDRKVVQYSSDEMSEHLLRSFELCKSHSDAFLQIWEGVI